MDTTFEKGLTFTGETKSYRMVAPKQIKGGITGYCPETNQQATYQDGVFASHKVTIEVTGDEKMEADRYANDVQVALNQFMARLKKGTEDVAIYRSASGHFLVLTVTEEKLGRFSTRFLEGFHYILKEQLGSSDGYDAVQRMIGSRLNDKMAKVDWKEDEPYRATLGQFLTFLNAEKAA